MSTASITNIILKMKGVATSSYTLSKCPGGHQILHRGLKINLKNSAVKYTKN